MDARRAEESFALAELARRMANVVRLGTVATVDHAGYRARVAYDTDAAGAPILTAPVPWATMRAGGDRTWWAPEEGEQVVLLAPNGDLAEAIALPALYSDARVPPSDDGDKHVTRYADGAVFTYDRDAHRWSVTLPEDGEMVITIGASTLRIDKARIKGDAPEVRWNA